MPNRILHERICVSESIAQLSADEERFFYRLLVQCDDYGRFDGRVSVIRARCFALQLDVIGDDDVRRWLDGLIAAGLVQIYTVDDRSYLRVTTWERHQQTRAKRSKFPQPPADDDSVQASDSRRDHVPAHVTGIRESINENTYTPPIVPPSSAGEDIAAIAAPPPKRGGKRPKTEPPEVLEPNEADYAAGARVGLTRAQVVAKAAVMLDYHRKEAKSSADWHASLRTWLGNTPKFDAPRSPPNGRASPPRPDDYLPSTAHRAISERF